MFTFQAVPKLLKVGVHSSEVRNSAVPPSNYTFSFLVTVANTRLHMQLSRKLLCTQKS